MTNTIDRVDEKLTDIAVNVGCGTTSEIVQFVRDMYRAMDANDNLEIIRAVSRTGFRGIATAVLKQSREIQRELGADNARREEQRKKEEAAAKKAKPKSKTVGNAEDAPA